MPAADPVSDLTAARLTHAGAVPVWVIDAAHPDPDSLVEAAAASAFTAPAGDLYPGVVAPAPDGYATWLRDRLDAAGVLSGGVVRQTRFALACADPATLAPIQRIPHFDTPDPGLWAVVHYLCHPPHAGTGFYHHRASGLAMLDGARAATWPQLLAADARRLGLPPPAYVAGDTTAFVRTGAAPLAWNRLVLYPASCLHAGDIGASWRQRDPRSGRLTITALVAAAPACP